MYMVPISCFISVRRLTNKAFGIRECLKVYVGRFAGNEQISNDEWSRQISIAEKLLIYTHSPALNSSNINNVGGDVPIDSHVYNWGNRRNLLPEVSALRYLYDDNEHFPTYQVFGGKLA
ncbi:hypothetical protein [Vibrio taketomensis]|uniref:hypothetical protein n=1 Tax=Vibrio taketomensis TaxID=2572923 RepID=UPI001E49C074|nr:hypothetical protein [Vibrio taketomensis]